MWQYHMAECMEVLKWEKFLLPHNYMGLVLHLVNVLVLHLVKW